MPKVRKGLTPAEQAYKSEIVTFCRCGMLNQSMVMSFFGWSKNTAKAWLSDIPCINTGGQKMYTASDIARKMARQQIQAS